MSNEFKVTLSQSNLTGCVFFSHDYRVFLSDEDLRKCNTFNGKKAMAIREAIVDHLKNWNLIIGDSLSATQIIKVE